MTSPSNGTGTGTGTVALSVLGTDRDSELSSLLSWLRYEDDLRGRIALAPHAPGPGEMGSMAEVLTVALGSGGAGAVLARSLSTWLTQRRADVKLTLTAGDRTLELEARRVPDAQALLREVGDLLNGLEAQQWEEE